MGQFFLKSLNNFQGEHQKWIVYKKKGALLPPLKTRKIRILKKWKKSAGGIILLHICHFWPFFLPFTPRLTLKIKIWKKMKKKTPGYIILLHMCTMSEGHMMDGSWDMECDRHNFFSFCTSFCLMTLLTTQKMKILKKWEKHVKRLPLYLSSPQMTIIWCMVSEISSATHIIFSCFGPFFTLLPPPLQPRKSKFWKNEK